MDPTPSLQSQNQRAKADDDPCGSLSDDNPQTDENSLYRHPRRHPSHAEIVKPVAANPA